MSLKLDMSKAFDRIEWEFLKHMLLKFGFDAAWVKKIMLCVTTVQYRIQINETLSEVFRPGRGLRQGDPISPYLFILCSEWFSRALQHWQERDIIKGVRISSAAPPITHLFFADDSIIFLRGNLNEVRAVKDLLEWYERISGQQINYRKSELVVSQNTPSEVKLESLAILGVEHAEKHSRYLGLPTVIGLNKTEVFRGVEDRVVRKIQDWSSKLLSRAGKEILIKSTVQAIPLYAMQCFRLPTTMCDNLQKNMLKFWWGSKNHPKPIHWICKEVLFCDKERGGLGFKRFVSMNEALLLKQAWRILSNPHTLLSKVLKGRYFRDGNLISASLGNNPSHGWRSIVRIKHLLNNGLDFSEQSSTPRWKLSSSGDFTVKSAYNLIEEARVQSSTNVGEPSERSTMSSFWKFIWKADVPPKLRILVWRLFHNSLPDSRNLARRGCGHRSKCPLCGFEYDEAMHLFRGCWRARMIWDLLGIEYVTYDEYNLSNPADWLFLCATRATNSDFRLLICGIWAIWDNRNAILHGGLLRDGHQICRKVKELIFQYDQVKGSQRWAMVGDSFLLRKVSAPNIPRIYCDGAWYADNKRAGYAAIAMDGKTILGVRVAWRERVSCARTAEGLAVALGAELANELNLEEVTLATDSVGVAAAVQMSLSTCSGDVEWLELCFRKLQARKFWTIDHIAREENQIADLFASVAVRSQWTWNRSDSCPWLPEMSLYV